MLEAEGECSPAIPRWRRLGLRCHELRPTAEKLLKHFMLVMRGEQSKLCNITFSRNWFRRARRRDVADLPRGMRCYRLIKFHGDVVGRRQERL